MLYKQTFDSKVDSQTPSSSTSSDPPPETPVCTNESINRPPKQKHSQPISDTMEKTRKNERSSIRQQLNAFLGSAASQTVAAEDLEAMLTQVFLEKLQGREDRGTLTVRKNFPEHYDPEADKAWLRKVFWRVLSNGPLVAAGGGADEDMDDEELPPPLATTKAERMQQDALHGVRQRTPAAGKKGTSEVTKYLNETAPIGDASAVQQRRANPTKNHQRLCSRTRVHYDEWADDGEESEDGEAEPDTPTVKQPESFVACDRSLAIRNGCAEAPSSNAKAEGAERDTKVSGLSRSGGGLAPSVIRSWRMVDGKMVVCPPFADAESQIVAAESTGSRMTDGKPKVAATVLQMDPLLLGINRSWQCVDGKMVVWPPFDGETIGEGSVRGIKRKIGVEEEGTGTGKKMRTW